MSTAPDTLPEISLKPAEWGGSAGERWARNLDQYETMLAPMGAALLDHAALTPGLTVAEIGSGGGAVSRGIAERVGSTGSVVGLDLSPDLTALAAERAAAAGLANATYLAGDAGSATPPGAPFDRLMSRFGIMFFPDPPAAFAGLRKLLRAGGRADFAVWAPPPENPSISMLGKVSAKYLSLPKPVPHATGPFAFDDPDYFGALLTGAGFKDPKFEKWQGIIAVGGGMDAAGAADFVMGTSTLAEALADQPAELLAQIRADVTAAFAPHEQDGKVMLPASVFLVTASG